MESRQRLWYWGQIVLLLALFFVALCYVLALSLGLDFAHGEFRFGLGAYGDVFRNQRVFGAFLTSVKLGVWAALVAVPVAVLVARQCLNISNEWFRLVVLGVFVLPLLSSSLLRMFGYSSLLSEGGPFTDVGMLSYLSGKILFSESATTLGLVSLVLPIGIIVCYIHLRLVSADIIAAAANLGAFRSQIFWHIEIPACRVPAIMIIQIATLFSFADIFSQSILGGNSVYTFAAALRDRIKINDWGGASAMATLLVLFTASVVATLVRALPNAVRSR